MLAFILGGLAYAFMAFMGSYGIYQYIQVFCTELIEIPMSKINALSRDTFR